MESSDQLIQHGQTTTTAMRKRRLGRSKIVRILAVVQVFAFSAFVSLSRVRTTTLTPSSSSVPHHYYEQSLTTDREQQEQFRSDDEAISSSDFAIFYHIYIPRHRQQQDGSDITTETTTIPTRNETKVVPTSTEKALNIVREQMEQIGQGYVGHLSSNKTATVFYTTIGEPLPQHMMPDICRPLNLHCQHLGHYISGFEEITLTHLYEYCWMQPTRTTTTTNNSSTQQLEQEHRVVYMHSKGSFHELIHGRNDKWRWHLTKAVTSKGCLEYSSRQFNTCGLKYYPIWASMYMGNFWVADCSYIRQLLPPFKYQARVQALWPEIRQWQRNGNGGGGGLASHLYRDDVVRDPNTYGGGRFSAEQWVGSHPSMRPGDVSGIRPMEFWWKKYHPNVPMDVAQGAPRMKWSTYRMNQVPQHDLVQDKAQRMTEWFLLAGRLWQWINLYNATPSNDSWVYKWYPDGDEWKHGVETFGANVVWDATRPYVNPTTSQAS